MKTRILAVSLFTGIFMCTFLYAGGRKAAPKQAPAEAEDVWTLLEKGDAEKARALFLGQTSVGDRDSRGRTPLHMAAETGDSALASFFISLGAEVDAVDNDGRTPLGISAGKRDGKTAGVFTAAGADIHASMPGGTSPAATAVSSGGAFLRAILDPASVKSTDNNGRTILHIAAAAGSTEAVRIILEGESPLDSKDNGGKNPLDLALERPDSQSHMECAELLILRGARSDLPLFAWFAPAARIINYNIRGADGSAPLHAAAREGYTGFISFLIARKADVNIKNASGTTPLHEAARSGNMRAMELLLDEGAGINAQDAKGNTVLHVAIPEAVHREALSLFLSRGANPNIRDVHGESPLHIAVTLNRGPDIIQTLLGGGADTSIRNIDGKTALYLAIEENREGVVPPLLSYGSDIFAADNAGITPYEKALLDGSPLLEQLVTEETVQKSDSAGNTLLHITIRNHGSAKIAGLILDRRAMVNVRNKEGDTGLHIAARQNEEETGSLLLSRGADIFAPNAREESPLYLAFHSPGTIRKWMITPLTLETRDGLGNSILHYAAQWKLDAYIPYLIQEGAPTEAANATGETPLFTAAKYNGSSTIRVLLAAGASLHARDSLGNSALHTAVRWNAPLAAGSLLDAGSDINAHNLAGETPLHETVRLGIADLETMLIRRGADLEARDNGGNTPFMAAVTGGITSQAERLANHGADPVARNARGDTPLHAAVAMERSDLVTLLLDCGAPIHARNSGGKTPFLMALSLSPRMVSTLLTKDRIYASDDDGSSPLTIAVREKAPASIVKTIIDQGARLNPVDREGRTPLRLASDGSAWELAKLIADAGADPFISANDGRTPAETALSAGEEGVRALFSGRGINARDSAGNTILHYAAKIEKPELVVLLLELGANKNVKNIAAESPADIALRWNHAGTAALLN
ncbi:MAG: ankyrin repeat domain-containing protein [Treponema sp.]|jgi:ankyrin repeat protein|nr:ankyrin repeat domain-containing protein [Treponema sp.]